MSSLRAEMTAELGPADQVRVVACHLTEGLSQITAARLEVAADDALDLEGLLLGPARLTLRVGSAEARSFTLMVDGGELLGPRQGALRYVFELRAPPFRLAHVTDLRRFRDMSSAAIVEQLFAEHGLALRFDLKRPPAAQSYTVQYRETSLAFVERLLERDGIYYAFDSRGALVAGDDSTTAPDVPGQMYFELIDARGALVEETPGIHAVRRRARVASGRATVGDFDWHKPRLRMFETSAAEVDADLEMYEHPGGFREPAEGAAIARRRLEELRVPARQLEGRSDVVAFAPGYGFILGGAAGAALGGEYVLVALEHHFELGRRSDGEGPPSYANTFRAIPRDAPYRPARRTPRPVVRGTHTAMVRGPAGAEIHTDRHGRFKAQLHWDREAHGDDTDSRWLRLLQESSTSMALARVGWEMLVGYEHADPDKPVGLGRTINGAMPPSYAQPGNMTLMSIKTPSSPSTGGYSELKLDDKAGAMLFHMRAERDMSALVENDRDEEIGRHETRTVGDTLSRAVGRDEAVQVGVHSTTRCGAEHRTVIGGDRLRSLGGDETVKVGQASRRLTEGDQSERVGTTRTTLAGGLGPGDLGSAAMGMAQSAGMSLLSGSMPSLTGLAAGLVSHGSITRRTSQWITRSVGGGLIAAAGSDITTSVGLAYAELIGGAKITVAATGSIREEAGGVLALTVGGAVLRSSGDNMSIRQKAATVSAGAAASFSAGGKLQVNGRMVQIVAAAGLNLEGGGISVSMSPGSIEVSGTTRFSAPEITLLGGKLDVTTS